MPVCSQRSPCSLSTPQHLGQKSCLAVYHFIWKLRIMSWIWQRDIKHIFNEWSPIFFVKVVIKFDLSVESITTTRKNSNSKVFEKFESSVTTSTKWKLIKAFDFLSIGVIGPRILVMPCHFYFISVMCWREASYNAERITVLDLKIYNKPKALEKWQGAQ